MKKTIFALCIAFSIFICNSLSVSAAVCPNSTDGVHHFETHIKSGVGYAEDAGTHRYIYNKDDQWIRGDDCKMIRYYYYCRYKCSYCSTYADDEPHVHLGLTTHSVDHN